MTKFLKKDNVLTFVDDPVEIEYLKFNNMRFSTIGCMLGDFDDKGVYCVDPRIVKELISMKKFLTSTVDNIEVCHSQLKLNKQISFFVVYEGNKVSLILAEKMNYQANFKINSGVFSNVNEFVLDSFETSGQIDRNVIHRKWNIDIFPGEVLDIFHMDEEALAIYFNLTKRFKYLMRANEILLAHEDQLEEIEANYAIETLAVVNKYPKLKVIVEKELKSVFGSKKDFLRADKPNFSKALNEVIAQAVDQNVDVLGEDKQYFLAERRHAQMVYNQAVAKEIPTAKLITKDTVTDEVINNRQIIATYSREQAKGVKEVAAEYAEQRSKTEQRPRGANRGVVQALGTMGVAEKDVDSIIGTNVQSTGTETSKGVATEQVEGGVQAQEPAQILEPEKKTKAPAEDKKKAPVKKEPAKKEPVKKEPVKKQAEDEKRVKADAEDKKREAQRAKEEAETKGQAEKNVGRARHSTSFGNFIVAASGQGNATESGEVENNDDLKTEVSAVNDVDLKVKVDGSGQQEVEEFEQTNDLEGTDDLEKINAEINNGLTIK